MEDELSIDGLLNSLNEQLEKLDSNLNNQNLEELEDKLEYDIELIKECNNYLEKMKGDKEKEKIKKNKFTIEEKQSVLTLLSYNISKHSIEKKFGIDRKTIRGWEAKREEIMNEDNKKAYRLKGAGRHPITKDIENEILIWINTCRRNGVAVSCNQIIAYGIKLNGKDFKLTYNAYRCWVKRFLKRHNLSIRKASYLGQKMDKDIQNLTYKFLLNCIKTRIKTQINDDIHCLVNVDETPCYLENPSKDTVDIKGKKQIDIITYGKDKCRITAVLSITASGEKLPPLLILKGKVGKRKEEELNKLEIVKKKKIFVKCQEKAWCNTELFKFWINNVFIIYQKLVVKKNCILILDQATSHINNGIINYLNNNNITYIIIPPGFTRFLQPLDLSINKPFKMALRKQYLNYQQKNLEAICENKFNINSEDIIKMVLDIWTNENDIKKNIIIDSFLYCGISQKLDGSQDELFRWPDLVYSINENNEQDNIINDIDEQDD